MKLLNKIKSFFGVKTPMQKAFPELSLEPITIGNKTFYRFTDDTLMPVFRAAAYINYRQMMDNRINQKDVYKFIEMIEGQVKAFTKANKDNTSLSGIIETFTKINQICGAMRAKNDLALDTDIVYTLASIIFVSENENPNEYDEKLQIDKIKHFREQGQYFFYLMPVKKLLPPLITSQEAYNIFIQELEIQEKKLTDFITRLES